jgi:hypothetical protein
LSRSSGQVTHVLLTRSRLCPRPKPGSSHHLHVLSTPPAFVLSQDQTLREVLPKSCRVPLMGPAVHRGDPDARRKWLADRHEAGRSDLDIRRSSRPPSVHAAEFSKTVALLRRGFSSDSTRPDETSPRRDKRTVEYSAGVAAPIGFSRGLTQRSARPVAYHSAQSPGAARQLDVCGSPANTGATWSNPRRSA